MAFKITPGRLRFGMNLWPPFWAAGIRVLDIGADWRSARVRLSLHWFNRNYFGTHSGGSLYALTDPFFALLIVESLGSEYIVWDKAAEIEFIKAVREPVYAELKIDDALLHSLRSEAASGAPVLRWLTCEVQTASGQCVARVRKQVYVRLKPQHRHR